MTAAAHLGHNGGVMWTPTEALCPSEGKQEHATRSLAVEEARDRERGKHSHGRER
jgi:hypothetical protein